MSTRALEAPSAGSFASWSPWIKLGLWLGLIAVLGTAVQGIRAVFGAVHFWPEPQAQRTCLIVAVCSFWFLLRLERRSGAEYGLVLGPHWRRHLLGGLAAGIGTCVGLYVLAIALGAFTLWPAPSAWIWLRGSLKALLVVGAGFGHEMIFRGYWQFQFRQRHGTVASIFLAACCSALVPLLTEPTYALTSQGVSLMAGLFLTGALCGVLRALTGTVFVPAALMVGWLYVEAVVRKTSLGMFVADTPWTPWLRPGIDFRQGPLCLALLLAVLGFFSWRLWRRGESVLTPAEGSSAALKRYIPFSSMSLLAPLDLWVRCLWDARFAVGWRYWPRLLATLTFSLANTLLSLPERLLLPWLLRRRSVPDPVFIVGVHRSGTSHLHNLLSLDPRFITPRTYQAMNPVGFLVSGWLWAPLLALFMPRKRPMDNVDFSLFTTQEEEFALGNLCACSPHWSKTLPRRRPIYDRFAFSSRFTAHERQTWKRHLLLFLRKLILGNGKRPLLKNPYNTARLELLLELFPRARFIHIYRHPFAVYRSNVHLAAEADSLLQVQDPDASTSYAALFLDSYRAMEEDFYHHSASLPPGQVTEVAFEDLERDPLGEIERMYRELGLELRPEYLDRLRPYLQSVAGYQKNRFANLPPTVRQEIEEKLGPLLRRWGYETGQPPGDAARVA